MTPTSAWTSALVWPLSRWARTTSLRDSTAETTKRQPRRRRSGRWRRWRRGGSEGGLDVGGESEGDPGERGVERLGEGERVAGAVEEIGVAEGHVPGPGADLLPHVGEDDVRRHDDEAPAVDRWDRAVAAA